MKGVCYICKKQTPTHRHHIYGGANRPHSEKYNLVVDLCPDCHLNGSKAVHKDKNTMEKLHRAGQRAFERVYTRQEFVKIFGKNYL